MENSGYFQNQTAESDYFQNQVIDTDYFQICVPHGKGKMIAVTTEGEVKCQKDNGEIDRQFLFLPVPGSVLPEDDDATDIHEQRREEDENRQGYYIVSANYSLALNYNPVEGEQIKAVPFGESELHTIWYVSPDSEIFTLDQDGEKKYLWSALDNIYVTRDEHLAEPWVTKTVEGKKVNLAPEHGVDRMKILGWSIFVVILILLLFLFYKK